MNADWGTYSLMFAILVAAVAVFFAVMAIVAKSVDMLRYAQWMMGLFTGLITLASYVLTRAFLDDQFQVLYVYSYSEQAMSDGYKFAAFWAGQEGSLLLWTWLLGVLCTVAVMFYRRGSITERAVMLSVLALVSGFFASVNLFAANPFSLQEVAPPDGRGLNPLLQDPWMIIHPPLLFVGYAGFTIPFAILAGALAANCKDRQWIAATRPWLIVSWLFLGAGIILGAKWAYIELGWGGYWAWDPVENASLLPWLTATALLHSIMVQQVRGQLKGWNASLIAGTFFLCIFGTYLTRSGVVQSVHSFGESVIGMFFLVFMLVGIAGTIGLFVWRKGALKAENPIEALMSREGAFLATNVLLTLMMSITLLGTVFPIISSTWGESITVKPPFYNKVIGPLSLVLLAMMAFGPLLIYGPKGPERLKKGFKRPLLIGAGAALLVLIYRAIVIDYSVAKGPREVIDLLAYELWMPFGVWIAVSALVTVASEMLSVSRQRSQFDGVSLIAAALRVINDNRRRYGAQAAHIGMVLAMLGIIASSVFETTQAIEASVGESKQIGNYTVTIDSVEQIEQATFVAAQANVTLMDAGGRTLTLHPQLRRYFKWREQVNSEVALRSTLVRDVYVNLASYDPTQSPVKIALEVRVKPMVSWIWFGTLLMGLGAVFALIPKRQPQIAPASATEGRTVALPQARMGECPSGLADP